MLQNKPSIINIGLVGGGDFCKEILEKTTAVYEQEEMVAPILAVADPDPESPGRKLASKLGLLTFDDYRQLYDRRYSIHLIIILTPEPEIFDDILKTRPSRIRILAYQVFRMFWKTIGLEMEGGHFQRAISAAIIKGNAREDMPVRYAYYASDNPLKSGQTLAAGPMGLEGIRPTYMITRAIIQKILST